MCGITGVIGLGPQPPDSLDRALAVIAHRGPDASHVWASAQGNVLLGCQRLAIIDPSPAADQPMSVGHVVVVNNGEIYNHVELRQELEGRGYHFRTRSDTEVLASAFLEWGPAMLQRLNGMFAMAIWDQEARRLFLARDRLGEKPLYYASAEGRFAFASEPKALAAFPWVVRTPNYPVLMRYLQTGDVPDGSTETFFSDIHQLRAGHQLKLEFGAQPHAVAYWALSAGSVIPCEPGLAQQTFNDLLSDATRLRLRSDVAYGLSVSGGVDSSLIAERVRFVLGPEAVIASFSAVHPGEAMDESRHIDVVSARLNLHSERLAIDPRDLERDGVKFVWNQDEPCPHSSQYAHWKLAEFVSQHAIRVLIEGQGADELFGGYHAPAFGHRWLGALRSGRMRDAARGMRAYSRLQRRPLWIPLGFLAAAGMPRPLQNAIRLRQLSEGGLLRREWGALAARNPVVAASGPFSDPLRRELWEQTAWTSLPGILRYVDRNSMAHSVEARLPFLDYRLVEFAFTLPPNALIADGWNKLPLRAALRPTLPEIASRPDKVGFATPERSWLRAPLRPWVAEILATAASREYYRPGAVGALWRRFLAGDARSEPIWRVLNAELWLQLFVDRTPSRTPSPH